MSRSFSLRSAERHELAHTYSVQEVYRPRIGKFQESKVTRPIRQQDAGSWKRALPGLGGMRPSTRPRPAGKAPIPGPARREYSRYSHSMCIIVLGFLETRKDTCRSPGRQSASAVEKSDCLPVSKREASSDRDRRQATAQGTGCRLRRRHV